MLLNIFRMIHYTMQVTLQKKVLSLIDNLISFSQMGRIVPEYNNPKIREILYQNYRIVYRIKKNAIYIVLIIHGTKELPQIIS